MIHVTPPLAWLGTPTRVSLRLRARVSMMKVVHHTRYEEGWEEAEGVTIEQYINPSQVFGQPIEAKRYYLWSLQHLS